MASQKNYYNINEAIKDHLEFDNLQVRHASLTDLAGSADIPENFNLRLSSCYLQDATFAERSTLFCGKKCTVLGTLTGSSQNIVYIRASDTVNVVLTGFKDSIIRIADLKKATITIQECERCLIELVNIEELLAKDLALFRSCSECEIVVYNVVKLSGKYVFFKILSSYVEVANLNDVVGSPTQDAAPSAVMCQCQDSDIYFHAKEVKVWDYIDFQSTSLRVSYIGEETEVTNGFMAEGGYYEIRNIARLSCQDTLSSLSEASFNLREVESITAKTVIKGSKIRGFLFNVQEIVAEEEAFILDNGNLYLNTVNSIQAGKVLGNLRGGSFLSITNAESLSAETLFSLVDSQASLYNVNLVDASNTVSFLNNSKLHLASIQSLSGSTILEMTNSKAVVTGVSNIASMTGFMLTDSYLTLKHLPKIQSDIGIQSFGKCYLSLEDTEWDTSISLNLESKGRLTIKNSLLKGSVSLTSVEAVTLENSSFDLITAKRVGKIFSKNNTFKGWNIATSVSLTSLQDNISTEKGVLLDSLAKVEIVGAVFFPETEVRGVSIGTLDITSSTFLCRTVWSNIRALTEKDVAYHGNVLLSGVKHGVIAVGSYDAAVLITETEFLEIKSSSFSGNVDLQEGRVLGLESVNISGGLLAEGADALHLKSCVVKGETSLRNSGFEMVRTNLEGNCSLANSKGRCLYVIGKVVSLSSNSSLSSERSSYTTLSVNNSVAELRSDSVNNLLGGNSVIALTRTSCSQVSLASSTGKFDGASVSSCSVNQGALISNNSSLGSLSLSGAGALLLGGNAGEVNVSSDSCCLLVSSAGSVSNPNKNVSASSGQLVEVAGGDLKSVGANRLKFAVQQDLSLAQIIKHNPPGEDFS